MRSSQACLLTLAVAFFSAASAAQQTTTMGQGTAGGTSTVTVRVTYQLNHRPAAGMTVRLMASTSGMVDLRTTDGNGAATFQNVSSGRYEFEVSGPGIETTRSDSFMAGADEGGAFMNENVEVKLTEGADAVPPSPALMVPKAAEKEFKSGQKEMDDKNWEEAKDHFQKAIAAFPKYSDAFAGLGMAELQLKDGQGAMQAFRSAIDIDPNLQQPNFYLGQFYYENHQYKDAEPYLKRSAADQPKNAQILTVLANTELQNGETDLALADARKVPSLPDHEKFAISHLIVAQALTGKGQDDEIAKEYEEYLKEAPDSPLAPRVKDALAQMKPK